jgi:hypothetical protein
VEDIKEVESESSTEKVEKMLTEKVEESTSEKPTNVEWASDDQESVTGFFSSNNLKSLKSLKL